METHHIAPKCYLFPEPSQGTFKEAVYFIYTRTVMINGNFPWIIYIHTFKTYQTGNK